jgi:hypothetical protein
VVVLLPAGNDLGSGQRDALFLVRERFAETKIRDPKRSRIYFIISRLE